MGVIGEPEPQSIRRPGVPARAVEHLHPAPPRTSSARPRRRAKRHRGLKITLAAILAVVLAIGGGAAYAWFDLNGKFNSQGVEGMLGTNRPPTQDATSSVKYPGDPFAGRAVNILVLGTDSRQGGNAGISNDEDPGGVRSDTTFIAHVSADRLRMDVVSIPRDTWITIPDCTTEDGTEIAEAGWTRQGFNAAFAYGSDAGGLASGAACTIRAVEAMSDVHIDAYVIVDFMGFENVVNSIGGVDVTLLCRIQSDEAAGLDLPAGVNHLDGLTAVNLARARKGEGLGDGSDLQRIRRQHALFDAVIAKVYSMNIVTDFPKLYNMVGSVIGSVTTDLGTSLAPIAGFAYSLKNLDVSSITFMTIPIADAGDGAHVVLIPSLAEPIWESLRTDQPFPGDDDETVTETPAPEETDTPVDPEQTPAPAPTGPPQPIVIQSPYDCS